MSSLRFGRRGAICIYVTYVYVLYDVYTAVCPACLKASRTSGTNGTNGTNGDIPPQGATGKEAAGADPGREPHEQRMKERAGFHFWTRLR